MHFLPPVSTLYRQIPLSVVFYFFRVFDLAMPFSYWIGSRGDQGSLSWVQVIRLVLRAWKTQVKECKLDDLTSALPVCPLPSSPLIIRHYMEGEGVLASKGVKESVDKGLRDWP